jgi:hypothetical protein
MRHALHILGVEVAKVKKVAGVRGERNASGRGIKTLAGRAKTAAKKQVKGAGERSRTATVARAGRSSEPGKRAPAKRAKAESRSAAKLKAPIVRVAVKPLDPLLKCGPNTSVQFLYRVDESIDGRRTFHLVFFDHHGWYCEHGRTCPAVLHARKYNGQIARVS